MINRNLFERQYVCCLLILIASFCLYAVTFGATWTYDDYVVIVNSPDVKSIKGFLDNSYPGRPVRELSFLLDYALFGLNPAGWHFQSILWHGLSACLIFIFIQKLKIDRGVAFFSALVFLVHPIQAEVVAGLSHRKDSLALCFGLLSAILYFSSFSQVSRKKIYYLLGVVVCYLLALFSKQNMLLLPILFIFYELIYIDKDRRLLVKSPGLTMLISGVASILLVIYLYIVDIPGLFFRNYPNALVKMDVVNLSVDAYYRMVAKSVFFLFAKLFYPVDLAIEYVYELPQGWTDPWIVSAFVSLFAFSALMIWSWRKKKELFILLLWIPLLYLPTSNVYPISFFSADRYLYAPSVGVFVLVVFGVTALFKKHKVAGYCVLSAIILTLSALSFNQALVWKTPDALWENALKVSPTSVNALTNYGRTLLIKDQAEEALPYLLEAAQHRNWPPSYYYLGVAYEELGMQSEAIRYFCVFLRVKGPKLGVSPAFVSRYLIEEYGVDCR